MKIFKYMMKLQFSLLILLNLSAFASVEREFPQENVKLTGKYYPYPIGLEGSPYLQEEWQVGDLNLENGKTAFNVKVRFNIISNELVFYNESIKKVFILDRETIKSFVMSPGKSDSLLFLKYDGSEVGFKLKKGDYVHVLNQGKINFFVKHLADVINANDISSKDKVYPKKYYFVAVGEKTVEIKLSYRSVYEIFPSKKKELKKMIAENKLRKASVDNFIRLFKLIENTSGF